MLHNALGVGGCQISLKKTVTKIYGSTLLALLGGGCQISQKKHYVTPERPLMTIIHHHHPSVDLDGGWGA